MNLRKKHSRASAEVHTSAMNDIMFFLLLFFLIASTVTNPNVIKLMLPKSSSGQAVSKKTITVSVTQDLRYYLASELTIVLHVDRTVAIQDVVQVMDIAQKLNIKLVLATEPK
jgi:biopolymer transport protein ExbD